MIFFFTFSADSSFSTIVKGFCLKILFFSPTFQPPIFVSFRFIFVHKILLKNLKVVFYWISNLHHTHFSFYDLNYVSRYKAILKSKCFEFRITLSQAISWYNFEKIHEKFFKRSSDSEIMWVNELSHKKYLMLSHVILLWKPSLEGQSQVRDNFWQLKAL